MDPLAHALAESPELFPHALDLKSGAVTLVRLSKADYENASFLDGRIAASRPSRSLPWPALARAVDEANLTESCHFIFHIGHCGSTLLSRLLGRHPSLLSVREPEILRTLALARGATPTDPYLAPLLKLWSRAFDKDARALVKATSFVSDLAIEILARPYAPRALVMGVSPDTYLATIFGGENAPSEARALAPFRLARLNQRLGAKWRLEDMSEGEIIAMSWACEATALGAAAEAAGSRVLRLDFDRFLIEPHATLSRAFEHFGVRPDAEELNAILAGPEMRTYSKAPEFAYDSALRQAVLDQGRSKYAAEIRRGLQWLDRAASESPELGKVFSMFC
jgi:hypothetical protein